MTKLIVFVGPSLGRAEVLKLAPSCEVRPPARQGDIWRALPSRPRAIALIDGVFEATPSVWHHELLSALSGGVAVFGASSMGALRAAELHPYGMKGIGRIFDDYRSGRRVDDADVALLHADEENAFRPMTVPLVNAEHTAERAVRAKVLTPGEAKALVRAARALFYQDRVWPELVRRAKLKGPARFTEWRKRVQPDLKAEDARACIRAAWAWAGNEKARPPKVQVPVAAALGSSLVRRRRLWDVEGAALKKAQARKDARHLTDAGLRRMLLAAAARAQGITPNPAEVQGIMFQVHGLPDADARAVAEEMVLEQWMLDHAQRLIPDGPSPEEALALEAKLRGLWKTGL